MSEIHGADVSTLVSVDGWSALARDLEVSLGVVRCYQSSGRVDPCALRCLMNAREAGIPRLDVYHFPSFKVGAEQQVNASLDALSEVSASLGCYWLDIEDGSSWSPVPSRNVAFLQAMIGAVEERGSSVGIYTVRSSWRKIMGNDASFASYPLWYAAPDGVQSFNNYEGKVYGPIGGWAQPVLKQLTSTQTHEGVAYDGNWAPEMP